MQIKATLNGDAATLVVTTNSSTANLEVTGAAALADDIEASLNAGQEDIYRDTYQVLMQADGIQIGDRLGTFPIPWQWIISVVAQLRAGV